MAELIFVRHAPTSWSGRRFCGRADPPLNRAGQLVARSLAAELAAGFAPGSSFRSRIISSPARRARQTAAAVARAVPGLRVELDERWAEVDFGRAEGLTFDELIGVEPELAARLSRGDGAIDWPDGESATSLAERVGSALRDLADEGLPTIVLSHAGPLRIAIALAMDVPIDRVALLDPGGLFHVAGGGRH